MANRPTDQRTCLMSTRVRFLVLGILGACGLLGVGGTTWALSHSPSQGAARVEVARVGTPSFSSRFASNHGSDSPSAQQVSPDDLMQAIIARSGTTTSITEVRIGGAPADFPLTDDPAVPVDPKWIVGLWAYVTVQAPVYGPEVARLRWETFLILGALRDEMRRAGLPPLVGCEFKAVFPDARTLSFPCGIRDVAPNQTFDSTPAADVQRRVESAAHEHGLTPLSVKVLTAGRAAPAVVAVTDTALTPERMDALVPAIFGASDHYEGFYFEVRRTDDTVLAIRALAASVGVGTSYGVGTPSLTSPSG